RTQLLTKPAGLFNIPPTTDQVAIVGIIKLRNIGDIQRFNHVRSRHISAEIFRHGKVEHIAGQIYLVRRMSITRTGCPWENYGQQKQHKTYRANLIHEKIHSKKPSELDSIRFFNFLISSLQQVNQSIMML